MGVPGVHCGCVRCTLWVCQEYVASISGKSVVGVSVGVSMVAEQVPVNLSWCLTFLFNGSLNA